MTFWYAPSPRFCSPVDPNVSVHTRESFFAGSPCSFTSDPRLIVRFFSPVASTGCQLVTNQVAHQRQGWRGTRFVRSRLRPGRQLQPIILRDVPPLLKASLFVKNTHINDETT
jgi:hypothetical protein